MKKFIIVLLAAALMTSFISCSDDKDPSNVTGSVQTYNEADETKATSETEEPFKQGTVAQQTYKNEFIGLGCTLDNDWTFYSDEQIAELNGLAAGAMDDEVANMIENATIIYDMFAENTATAENINLNLEKLTRAQVLLLDLETMYNSQAANIKSTYENLGYTNFSYEVGKAELAGKQHTAMFIKATLNDVELHQTLVAIKTGQYIANIAATSYNTNTTKDILSKFFSLGVNN